MTRKMTCTVCGEPAEEENSTICNNCEQRFHLRMRDGDGGKDCGDVWINEQYMSLEFACFTCLGTTQPAAGVEPPVGRGH